MLLLLAGPVSEVIHVAPIVTKRIAVSGKYVRLSGIKAVNCWLGSNKAVGRQHKAVCGWVAGGVSCLLASQIYSMQCKASQLPCCRFAGMRNKQRACNKVQREPRVQTVTTAPNVPNQSRMSRHAYIG